MLFLDFIILECCVTYIAIKTDLMNIPFMLIQFFFRLKSCAANVTPTPLTIRVFCFDMSC